ncbi:glycosyltransferase family 2 protein [Clostridium sp. ZBS12]|uniref:glycosyltransferase family 2 protein n=1 Tax=Clostridium sp. ZBS12 TaxID=2949972 RepID=UPI00207A028F|nr:glycosyltransferase family 2 protein [Clostridium sp. ZBS12]
MEKQRILIFIPMYNCEKQISRVLNKIKNLKEKQKIFTEIIVVDNRSSDNSIQAAKEAAQNLLIPVKIFKNKNNRGLGGSHKVAFNYAIKNKFDYVIVLHGDDQGDITDVIKHIEDKSFERYDSFLGSRFESNSKLINYSKFRIFGNHIFNKLISVIINRKITDLGSGLNVYKIKYLKNRFFMNFPNNLTFNVYMLLYGVYCKSNFEFFPLSWREEDQVSNAKLFSQSMEIINLVLKFKFKKKYLFAKENNKFSELTYDYDIVFYNKQGVDYIYG